MTQSKLINALIMVCLLLPNLLWAQTEPAAPWPQALVNGETFKRGMNNPYIQQVQQKLVELGHKLGKPDGIYGQRTVTAIAAFQKTQQLSSTGAVDLATWQALFPAATPTPTVTPSVTETPTAPDSAQQAPSDSIPSNATPPSIEKQNIHIGVLYYGNAEETLLRWVPLVDYLSTQFQHYRFVIEPFTQSELKTAIQQNKVVFVLSDPAVYIDLERHAGAQVIATLNTRRANQPFTEYGTAIVKKTSRHDIATLQDLKGKTFIAGPAQSWDDWLITKNILLNQGINPEQDFQEIKQANSSQQALFAVKNGFADAASVAMGTLEELTQSLEIEPDEITLVGPNMAPEKFPFQISSPLYPEWPLASLPTTPAQLSIELLVALLQLPATSTAAEKGHYTGWVPAKNYQAVHQTLQQLQAPPYENSQTVTIAQVWSHYSAYMMGLMAVLLGLALTSLYLGWIVIRHKPQTPARAGSHQYRLQLGKKPKCQDTPPDTVLPSSTAAPKLLDLAADKLSFQDIFLKLSSMALVMVVSVLLLVYVSNGEAKRVYERFQLDKLSAQGEIVKILIEDFLKEGLPFSFITHFLDENLSLGKFAGFTAFSGDSNAKTSSTLTIIGLDDEIIYTNAPEKFMDTQLDQTVKGKFEYKVVRNPDNYKMTFPLLDISNAEEPTQLGSLVITLPSAIVNDKINASFHTIHWVGVILILVFLAFSVAVLLQKKYRNRRFIEYAFGLTFMVMAGFVVFNLFTIYEEGAQVRTEALSQSLGQRLKAIAEVGTAFEDVEGLDKIFTSLQDSSPDISVIALVVNGNLLIHPNTQLIGQPWQRPESKDYLRIENIDEAGNTQLIVIMPWEIVRNQMLRSIKNFGSLFVACSFLAFIFLTAATSFQDLHRYRNAARTAYGETWIGRVTPSRNLLHLTPDLWLTLIQVVWFLAVFADGLNASFLPHFLKNVATTSNMPEIYGIALFSSFFAAFVLALAPAGRYAETREIKHLLLLGILLISCGLLTMAYAHNYIMALLARFISGAGHGIAFIGVQSFILSVAHKDKTTQGSARQVFALNSGLLSGSVIGALIVVYLNPKAIFILGSLIALFTLLVTIWLLPNVGKKKVSAIPAPASPQPQQGKFKTLLKDYEFIRTVILVGSASKVVYNGVVFLGIPLIMISQNFAQEDIGQALMIFAAATMITNYYVSILVDKMGGVVRILAMGMVILGTGGIIVGSNEWISQYAAMIPFISQIALILGIIALGIGNGLVAAPVVTHILDTSSVKVLGSNFTVAIYRVLERMGHVIGPLIVGQLLILHNQKAEAFSIVGLVMVLFGLTFYLFRQNLAAKKAHNPIEPAEE